jgi:ArsR family metal-binding transcriptional regulator
MSPTISKVLSFLGPLEPKSNYSKVDWIISGLSILIIILCLTGLVFWQVKEHSRHHSGEDTQVSTKAPFNPASNK